MVEKDNGCQLVRVNGGLDDCLTNSWDVSGSSDSGVQSWLEQWDNMSDNSIDGSYVDTGDLHCSVSDELARLLFDAPPNTEDEDVSGSPGTDTCATSPSPSRQPEAMFDDDRNLSCNDMTDSEFDSNSDLEEHSDVSDDSSDLGIRKVLRRRVPYRGRAPLPRKSRTWRVIDFRIARRIWWREQLQAGLRQLRLGRPLRRRFAGVFVGSPLH